MNIDNRIIEDFMHSKPKNFHTSWDLIIPVIEEIEKLDLSDYLYQWKEDETTHYNFNYVDFTISTEYIYVDIELDLDPPLEIHSVDTRNNNISKFEATYECIVEFLKYYNKLCKQNS